MKRFAWAVACVALAGCPDKDAGKVDAGPVDAGPVQLSEKEPNDRAEQALAIPSNSIVVAALSADPSKPDEDWYALTAAGSPLADVSVSGIAAADVVLALFDEDKNPIVTVNSGGDGKGERFPNIAVNRKVFVRVS